MAQGIQIGKVAEQTGLSIDTIRFYQKIGLVKQPRSQRGWVPAVQRDGSTGSSLHSEGSGTSGFP